MRTLLKRFETEDSAENDVETPRSPLTAFINQLSTLDEDELDKNLSGRVQEMLNLIGKLVQVYDTVSTQSRSVLEKIKSGESIGKRWLLPIRFIVFMGIQPVTLPRWDSASTVQFSIHTRV